MTKKQINKKKCSTKAAIEVSVKEALASLAKQDKLVVMG